MPAVGAFMYQGVEGINFTAGPTLVYNTAPGFQRWFGGLIGNLFGALFYFLVFIAAVTSAIFPIRSMYRILY